MNNPKVTVLMSIYNGERNLHEAIDSILNQTFENFEFLIVNDGSTDATTLILQGYSDPRIKIITNEKNVGLTRSLNKGLRMARGRYVARMDADDVSLPQRLGRQVEFLDRNEKIGAVGTAVKNIDKNRRFLGKHYVRGDHAILRAYLLINNIFRHPTLMIRRDLVEEIGGYDESLFFGQDYDLLWRLGRVTELANLPDALLLYRMEGNYCTLCNRQNQMRDAFKISLKAVRESLKGRSLDSEAYERFWWHFHWFLVNRYEKGQSEYKRLMQDDIKRLRSLWDLLEIYPAGMQVWSSYLYAFANYLLDQEQNTEGIHLLKVAASQVGQPIQ